jgi:hypothetical protein
MKKCMKNLVGKSERERPLWETEGYGRVALISILRK